MSQDSLSPLVLFKRFQPRFREIEWYPAGLRDTPRPFDHTGLGEKLYLLPGFIGHVEPIRRSWQDEYGRSYTAWWGSPGPFFDTRVAKLGFNFEFDPFAQEDFLEQTESNLWKTILEGPLKDRHFFMDPDFEGPCFPSLNNRISFINPSIRFSVEGEVIPGLNLAKASCHEWKVFIPDGPEREVIQAAFDLEEAKLEHKKSQTLRKVCDAKNSLLAFLQAIPS